jgi:hypothetical protein
MEGSQGIGDLVGELTGQEIGLCDEPLEVCVLLKEWVGVLSGGEERDPLFEDHPCETEWLHQIGVGGNEHREVVGVLESINQEMRREIHIRTLFLGLHDSGAVDSIACSIVELLGGCQHHPCLIHQEVTFNDGDEGVGTEGPQLEILSLALSVIGRSWMHTRGEILDGNQGVLGAEQPQSQRMQIKPFAGGSFFEGAVVEIEPVHIDSRTSGHCRTPQNSASHPEGGSATSVPEGSRGSHCRNAIGKGSVGNPYGVIITRTRARNAQDTHNSRFIVYFYEIIRLPRHFLDI